MGAPVWLFRRHRAMHLPMVASVGPDAIPDDLAGVDLVGAVLPVARPL
jgi:hypothetical protein